MEIYPVFQRIPDAWLDTASEEDISEEDIEGVGAWQERMDQLLFSDPMEIMNFVTDAVLSVAARMDPQKIGNEDPFKKVLDAILEAGEEERPVIIEMVRQRFQTMAAHFGEHAPGAASASDVFATIYKTSREEPWPWPKKQ